MSWLDPFQNALIPFADWIDIALKWVVLHFRGFFQLVRMPPMAVLNAFANALNGTPSLVILAVTSLIGWQLGGRRLALTVFFCLLMIGLIGGWGPAMTTLSIVLTCVTFCVTVGIPLGIVVARSDKMWLVTRPVLDTMQTIPSFVYLVPIVMLFGIGNVSGVIVTFIYALPPIVRLTNLGIRQVRSDLVEAAHAFGASPRQTLVKIELPLALPTIMAGVNQTIMMALAMVVVSSMIAVTGLGQLVLRGISQLDMGLASVGGLSIVLLAIVIDRSTQAIAMTSRERGHVAWWDRGPVGLVSKVLTALRTPKTLKP